MRDQNDQEVGLQEGPEEGDGEYHCTVAVKVIKDPVPKKDAETGKCSWLLPLTDVEIRGVQLSDPCLSAVIKCKELSVERPPWEAISMESKQFKSYWAQWSMLAVRDGVLFRKWKSERGDEIIWKLVLPGLLRTEVLRQLHDSPVTGHLGYKETIERVKARFYWSGLQKDVESCIWCARCDVCASRKKPCKKTPRASMKNYNVGAPKERIVIDVMGPLPVTD